MTFRDTWPGVEVMPGPLLTMDEIELRLTGMVQEIRRECDGELPDGFSVHMEDVGHALGLTDAAIMRVLGMDHMPHDDPPDVVAFIEPPTAETPWPCLRVIR